MKKTIIFVLATSVISTICMNESSYAEATEDRQKKEYKQRPQIEQQQKQSLFPLSPYSHENQNPIPVYITANEPGWEKYNHIMNAPYISNTPMGHNSINLMPIYIAREPEQKTPTKKEILDDIKTMLTQSSQHT